MTAKDLARMFEFNAFTLQKNIEAVTDEESLQIPEPSVNSMNWVSGHIVAVRAGLLNMVGGETIWNKEALALYRSGATPLTAENARPVEEIMDAFHASQRAVEQWIAESDARLNEIADGDGFLAEDETWGHRVSFFALHEAYHCGQIGYIRRLVGKEGVI
ncbi:DUF664 domain-containing protein [bacterium]|nr:DUF664 domain-containing protein [bacterium]